MAKKIHLINKKHGMSLVEMMASLAILLILFGGISSMILTNMKAEIKSNTRIENTSYIKAIIAMFETDIVEDFEQYLSSGKEISFNDMNELEEILLNEVSTNNLTNDDNKIYKANIRVENTTKETEAISELYKVYVEVENTLRGEVIKKILYINR